MANQRGKGEGTIYKMASGKWRAQFSGPLGSRLSYVSNTQADCQNWMIKKKSEQMNGINMLGGKVKLEDFTKNWLQSIEASRSPNTVNLYRRRLSSINQFMGKLSVNDVRPDHIQATYNKLLATGTTRYSVRQTHKVLHAAFAFAKKLRIIDRNPVTDATPPKHNPKKMSFYDSAQVQALLFGAQSLNDRYFHLYYLAISTGMRQGELLGLMWKDIDWSKAELRIKRQLVMYPNGDCEFRSPKSESGIRQIAVGEDVLELLNKHKAQQFTKKSQKSEDWNKNDLVFPSLAGTPVNASNLRRSFRKLLEFTGLPKIRFHDLRHTAATLMLNYGTPIPVVSQRLGHSKTSMTMDTYAHAIPSKQAEAAELMEQLMTPISIPTAHELHTEAKKSPFFPQI